jgi:molybdate transport system substrate-binding protein
VSDAIELRLLCAGAVKGLVEALRVPFSAAHDVSISARFGAVGAMKEALQAGEPCDLLIVTGSMIDALAHDGYVDGASCRPIGRVRTGVAVRKDEPVPDVSTAARLKALLLAAEGVYFPDPIRSTAGIHFADVLRKLELHALLEPKFHTYPNGAIAMRELAASRGPRLVGCTQVTEINYTEGVCLAGSLPQEFELVTVYAAAVTRHAVQAELARLFIETLAGDESAALRSAGGFEAV